MVFDEIVIGSGLSALATAMGISQSRRVLVIAGPTAEATSYYDDARSVPCAFDGFGGLGNFWHGVIPTGYLQSASSQLYADFRELFEHFYPGAQTDRVGGSLLFVPRRPIRPREQWSELLRIRQNSLTLVKESAERFELSGGAVRVITPRSQYHGRRVWVCAGALRTPQLLDRSLGTRVSKPTVSDHVIAYMGLARRIDLPQADLPVVVRDRHGVWFKYRAGREGHSLWTLRPARFKFRQLDYGMEQRAAFGLPTGGVVAKILRRASPGMFSEALYNKFGLFPLSDVYSAYAQIDVRDAYYLEGVPATLRSRSDAILASVRAARSEPAWANIEPSAKPDLYIRGIHLYGSVDHVALESAVGAPSQSIVQVTDASILQRIGPEHHSFRMMVAAAALARSQTYAHA